MMYSTYNFLVCGVLVCIISSIRSIPFESWLLISNLICFYAVLFSLFMMFLPKIYSLWNGETIQLDTLFSAGDHLSNQVFDVEGSKEQLKLIAEYHQQLNKVVPDASADLISADSGSSKDNSIYRGSYMRASGVGKIEMHQHQSAENLNSFNAVNNAKSKVSNIDEESEKNVESYLDNVNRPMKLGESRKVDKC